MSVKEKNKKMLVILGLFGGVLLIIFSFITPGGNNGRADQRSGGARIDTIKTDTAAYAAEHEKKLSEILKRIDGISDPFVMITLGASSEYIYATKQSIKESSSKDGGVIQRDVQRELILYEDEKKAKSPILVKEIKPEIKGVAIICKGISGEDMRLKIINLVSAALGLPADKIYVIGAD